MQSLSLIILFAGAAGCQSDEKEEAVITIGAAASLKSSLLELQQQFEREHEEVKLSFHFGSTGAIRKQVEQGAPIDVFLAASKDDYESLYRQGLVNKGDRLVGNRVVAVTNKPEEIQSLKDVWKSDQKVVIGNPATVPVGRYAKELLVKRGQWEEAESRLIYGKDARHVLMLMDQGAASVGLIYNSDVEFQQDLHIIDFFEEYPQEETGYYGAGVKRSKHQDASNEFLDFLESKEAKEIFKKEGFINIGE
ncbi:molybdate ABC transporter substrate-binding protein [Rossellomorea aquimaris]|uniref:Molybdate ABC transporter substrate-binding protein n=1 Tax=Rossellomorea aquimaris TaxID=189382 RepID=A0A1J6WSB8_9BACI|nr:molybdate ABC transporter substrate-binding protein [Rossellomorea aquimaris]OIU68729.1 molybdate ABC transporter substrate-binding protein [Rossellomorea aquimaris]